MVWSLAFPMKLLLIFDKARVVRLCSQELHGRLAGMKGYRGNRKIV